MAFAGGSKHGVSYDVHGFVLYFRHINIHTWFMFDAVSILIRDACFTGT